MYQPRRAADRTFTRRFLLGCLLLSTVVLLVALGAWLRSFTLSQPGPEPPAPAAAPPPATVTVTAAPPPQEPSPAERPQRRDRNGSAPVGLPPGTDGAAQTACSARAQAAALQEAGRRAEASVQTKAAEEAALASVVPALSSLKERPAKEVPTRLGSWCRRHFPDLGTAPLPESPRPTASGDRSPRPTSPVCRDADCARR